MGDWLVSKNNDLCFVCINDLNPDSKLRKTRLLDILDCMKST